MYDPASGRGYDGLDATTGKINLNSGAELTIEALMALQVIHQNGAALNIVNAKTVERNTTSIYEAEDFKVTSGNPQVITPTSNWTGDALYSGQIVQMSNNDQIQQEIEVAHKGEYLLYAALARALCIAPDLLHRKGCLMMTTGEPYHEKGVDYFRSQHAGKGERQLVRRLEQLGYQVAAPPAA